MRFLENFEDIGQAQQFSDLLTQRKIDNRLMEDEGLQEVWVLYEDQMEEAQQLLFQFQEDSESIDYKTISKEARKIKREAERDKKGASYMDARTTILNKGPAPRGALTMLFVLACVVVAFLSKLGQDPAPLRSLFITDINQIGNRVTWQPGLQEIMKGEFWRLITPMFIHFGFMHLIFNMMWLMDLGSMIEDRKSSLFLLVFVIVVSAVGNLAEYLVSHPLFGGMSGVVYGLLGYIWMKGKYDPASRLALHKTTVIMMIGWYFLCLTGLMGNIANAAHTAGLVIGVGWGYLSAKIKTLT